MAEVPRVGDIYEDYESISGSGPRLCSARLEQAKAKRDRELGKPARDELELTGIKLADIVCPAICEGEIREPSTWLGISLPTIFDKRTCPLQEVLRLDAEARAAEHNPT